MADNLGWAECLTSQVGVDLLGPGAGTPQGSEGQFGAGSRFPGFHHHAEHQGQSPFWYEGADRAGVLAFPLWGSLRSRGNQEDPWVWVRPCIPLLPLSPESSPGP